MRKTPKLAGNKRKINSSARSLALSLGSRLQRMQRNACSAMHAAAGSASQALGGGVVKIKTGFLRKTPYFTKRRNLRILLISIF